MVLAVPADDSSVCCVIVDRRSLARLAKEESLFFADSGSKRGIQVLVTDDEEVVNAEHRLRVSPGVTASPSLEDMPVIVLSLSKPHYVTNQEGSTFLTVPILASTPTKIRILGLHILDSYPKNNKEAGAIVDLSLRLLKEDAKKRQRKASAMMN